MSNTQFSSDLLDRLRRSVLLGVVLFVSIGAAACGDDDDDGISGPVADCIDDIDFNDWFFDENDLEALRDGDQESGSLSTSDVELDVEGDIFYYDVYAFSLEQDSDLRVTVNPSNDLNVNFEAWSLTDMEGDFNDAGGAGDTETVEYEAVPEGCYLLFVSSFEPEETGSYTVEIEEL